MFYMFFDLIAEFAFLFVQSYIDAKLIFCTFGCIDEKFFYVPLAAHGRGWCILFSSVYFNFFRI